MYYTLTTIFNHANHLGIIYYTYVWVLALASKKYLKILSCTRYIGSFITYNTIEIK